MIDPASQAQLKEAIADCIGTDQGGAGRAAGGDPPSEQRHTLQCFNLCCKIE